MLQSVAKRIEQYLDIHDELDNKVKHQGMVLTQSKAGKNSAIRFCEIYNKLYPNKCEVYVTKTKTDALNASRNDKVVLNNFITGKTRVLVIIGRLLEGFDHNAVSVLGIVRNIALTSRVLFAQFVGRAVRKSSDDDPVCAQIVTHEHFDQLKNFDKLADDDCKYDDEDEYDDIYVDGDYRIMT